MGYVCAFFFISFFCIVGLVIYNEKGCKHNFEAQNDMLLILVMTCYKIERFNNTKSCFVVVSDNINQTNNIMCEVKNNDNQIK